MLSFHNFIKRYGVDTTTNFDLIKWGKELQLKNFTVCMRDELLTLPESFTNIIVNYQTTNDTGSHWIALHKNENIGNFYFDSFGLQPFHEAEEFLKQGTYSTFVIQPFRRKVCGQLSLYLLYKINNGCDFYTTVLHLRDFYKHK